MDGSKMALERFHLLSRSVRAFIHFEILAATNVEILRQTHEGVVVGGNGANAGWGGGWGWNHSDTLLSEGTHDKETRKSSKM